MKGQYRAYNAQEWHDLGPEEQTRQIVNMVNNINRRMQRMETAGLDTVPGYEAVKQEAKRYGVTRHPSTLKSNSPARLTKAIGKMSEKQLRTYHSKLVRLTNLKTSSVTGAKFTITRFGMTTSGRILYTYEEYQALPDPLKSLYWNQFHRLRSILLKEGKYIAGSRDKECTLRAWNEVHKNAKKKVGERINVTKKRIEKVLQLQSDAIIEAGNYDKTPPTATGYGIPGID